MKSRSPTPLPSCSSPLQRVFKSELSLRLRIEREEDQGTFSGAFYSKGLGKQEEPVRGTEKKPPVTRKENKRLYCSGS